MTNKDTIEVIAREITLALLPLQRALASPANFNAFMSNLGWNVKQMPAPIQSIRTGLTTLESKFQELMDGNLPSIDQLQKAVADVVGGIQAIRNAPDSAIPPILRDDRFKDEFPPQLLDYLVIEYLTTRHPRVGTALRISGIIHSQYHRASGSRLAYTSQRLDFSALSTLLNDPIKILENAFGWRTDAFDVTAVLWNLDDLLASLGLLTYVVDLNDKAIALLDKTSTSFDDARRKALYASLFQQFINESTAEAGIGFFGLAGNATHKPGLAVLPYATGQLGQRFEITQRLHLELRGSLSLQGGLGIAIRPDEPIQVVIGFEDPNSATTAEGNVSVQLGYARGDNQPIDIFRLSEGTRLEFMNLTAISGLDIIATQKFDAYIEVELQGGKMVVASGSGDGFLQKILPPGGINTPFDLAIGWSNRKGLYFRGGASLEATLPVHKDLLGILKVDSIYLTLTARSINNEGLIEAVAAATASVKLGPFNAKVERMGLVAKLTFPPNGGNLGVANLDLGFKPPDGAGMVIDSPAIVGGGYLLFDPKNEQYAGILQIEIKGGISLKAIGLLTTRLPDGSKGFSLLVIITAEFPPIVLGFGFTLNGVGGLLGVNRTMVLEVLRAGIKNRTLDSIMFPYDPVKNAQKIISDLQSVFPPVSGQFVIGPMAKLAWGKPATILTIDLGILLEFPVSLRAVIMGRLLMVLPSKEVPIEAQVAVLRMDVLGTIDFNKGDAAIDATIYDSRVAAFTITGDMAMRLNWGASPAFALSAGGFNPRFQPPPSFPSLGRMAIALATGDNPRLRLEAYLALTTNTLQFGARLDLYAEQRFDIGGFKNTFSAAANLSFDALVNFQPFSFLVDIDGQAVFKRNGNQLLPVSLHLTLSGPQPWLAVGEVTFDFVGKHQIPINLRIGEEPAQAPPPPGNPLGELKQALQDPRNWSAQLPSDGHTLVTLRKIEVTKELLVHPFGELTVRQKVVPLEVAISKFGSTTPADKGPFTISSIRFGTEPTAQAREEARDHFAPGQFFDLSDDEKLSLPAFQPLPSGCTRIGTKEISFSSVQIGASFQYDTVVIDNKEELKSRKDESLKYEMPQTILGAVAILGAAGQSAMRSTGSAKFAGSGEQRVIFKDPEYAVASKDALAPETKTFESYVEAEAARRQKGTASTDYQTVGRHEVV